MGPSSRYRVYQFLPISNRRGSTAMGSAVRCQILFHSSIALFLLQGCLKVPACWPAFKRLGTLLPWANRDLIVIEGQLFPYAPPLIERLLCWLQYRLVFELDDAIYLTHGHERKMPVLLAMAAGVIAETIGWPPTLRNSRPKSRWSPRWWIRRDLCRSRFRRRSHAIHTTRPLQLSGSASRTISNIWMVAPALRRLQERYP